MKSVLFPIDSNLEKIGAYSFAESSLTFVTLPHKIAQIDKGAFSSCSYLQNVTFPQKCELKEISESSFIILQSLILTFLRM